MKKLVILLALFSTGCAIKKPVAWAYKPVLLTYCVQRNASGTQCLRWAPKVSYACVSDPATGDCTPSTK